MVISRFSRICDVLVSSLELTFCESPNCLNRLHGTSSGSGFGHAVAFTICSWQVPDAEGHGSQWRDRVQDEAAA